MKSTHKTDVPLSNHFVRPSELPKMQPEKLVKGKFREGERRCMTGWMLDIFLDSETPYVDAYKEFRCEMMDQMYNHFSEDHANTPEQRSKLWNMTADSLGYKLV